MRIYVEDKDQNLQKISETSGTDTFGYVLEEEEILQILRIYFEKKKNWEDGPENFRTMEEYVTFLKEELKKAWSENDSLRKGDDILWF